MKRFFCLLCAALLSVSLWGQERNLLSFTREYELPDKDPKVFLWNVFTSYQELTSYKSGCRLGNSMRYTSCLDRDSGVLSYRAHVENYTGAEGLRAEMFGPVYSFVYTMSVSITGRRVLFEMTEIVGLVNGNSLSQEKGTVDDFMTEGTQDVRGGLYGAYWRKHDRILREYLQEFFDDAAQLLYDSATD